MSVVHSGFQTKSGCFTQCPLFPTPHALPQPNIPPGPPPTGPSSSTPSASCAFTGRSGPPSSSREEMPAGAYLHPQKVHVYGHEACEKGVPAPTNSDSTAHKRNTCTRQQTARATSTVHRDESRLHAAQRNGMHCVALPKTAPSMSKHKCKTTHMQEHTAQTSNLQPESVKPPM